MLKITGLQVSYGEMQVLHGIDLTVDKGELVCVIGPNGAGKTTLIRSIMGLNEPTGGSILYEGQDITHMKAFKRAKMGIAYVPEGRRVFGKLTVEENLLIGCYSLTDKKQVKDSIHRVYEMLPRLGERRGQLARTMSGGEQQMLAIGRALAMSPRMLMIDEVSMGLMPLMVSLCFKIIKELNEQGITVLVVEQNANQALKIAHRGYVIETGNMLMNDTADNLLKNSMVQKAYLGD